MARALINIDYTNDFIAEDGALTCGEPGRAIEDEVVRLTREFAEAGEWVVFAVDVHEPGDAWHPETKLFPPHNLRGTKGRELYGKLGELYEEIRGLPNVLYRDKTRYSAFAGTDLDLRLRERGVRELHLVGDCTDICILHTAVDAYNLGYRLVIHERAVASFNAVGHEWALQHFRGCLGADIR
ncbi:cysteine hydrolase family protein [Paenibacillus pasadenensis]|uniref:Nicotinamidase n=1 Tax=Paenibacillus pasadenensis TaxID=217090 RepID=A0A2N5N6M5_9BACL|nr:MULTISPECIES: isochorismatase family cysteine hydrolase [Paenibacillus]PLT45975.1 Nicotinamidase [Paenibacillus pasadenensis]QGG56470.1 isochorismatase family protein [Paenibacillus sp. B01]